MWFILYSTYAYWILLLFYVMQKTNRDLIWAIPKGCLALEGGSNIESAIGTLL